MRNTFNGFILFVFLLPGTFLYAQQDTVCIETEAQKDDIAYYKNKYKYLNVRLSDEDKLIKLGVQPFKPSETFNFTVFSIHAGFEQKVSAPLSLISELNSVFTFTEDGNINLLGYSMGGRYYFLKKKEMAEGTSGNNCHGLYGMFKFNNILNMLSFREEGISATTAPSQTGLERYLEYALIPELGVGYQQRLDYHLYFDAGVSFNYDVIYQEFGFKIKFLFGGLLSFSK